MNPGALTLTDLLDLADARRAAHIMAVRRRETEDQHAVQVELAAEAEADYRLSDFYEPRPLRAGPRLHRAATTTKGLHTPGPGAASPGATGTQARAQAQGCDSRRAIRR